MHLLELRNIGFSYRERRIFNQLSLQINQRDRVGLVGPNGAGKSTLAQIIAGEQLPETGSLHRHSHLRIGYLHQQEHDLAHEIPDEWYEGSRIGLGKAGEWEAQRVGEASGGERTKLALLRVFAQKPDLLLLDEPSNHLDLEGVEWLVEQLSRFAGAVVIISHDRYLLDRTVSRIVELDHGRVDHYVGGYSEYWRLRQERRTAQQHRYEQHERQKTALREDMQRVRQWADRAQRNAGKVSDIRIATVYYSAKAKAMYKTVKASQNRLEQLEKRAVSRPEDEPALHFDFGATRKRGRRIMEASELGVSQGKRALFANSNFSIMRGERIAVYGPNGCGKTTLLRLVMGETPVQTGNLWISDSAKIGYMSQDMKEDSSSTLGSLFGDEPQTQVRTLLAQMGLQAEPSTPLGMFSLGERMRIKLAALMMQQHDLLILDEPGNHLDLYSREQLEQSLQQYKGTLLLVSHDRYMLEKLCDTMLVFEQGTIRKLTYGPQRYWSDTDQISNGGKQKDHLQSQSSKQRRRNVLGASVDDRAVNLAEEQMRLDLHISKVLGDLATCRQGEPAYAQLDEQYRQLLEQKRQLQLQDK